MQPFSNQDIPDYDMDSEDIKFFEEELRDKLKIEVTQLCFEDMIDRLMQSQLKRPSIFSKKMMI